MTQDTLFVSFNTPQPVYRQAALWLPRTYCHVLTKYDTDRPEWGTSVIWQGQASLLVEGVDRG